MRLPKKTKWVKKKNERPKGWQTCFGQLRGKGWCSCLLNGATLHTPDEWTGGGADISTVIYHPARPARKPAGPAARAHEEEKHERKIEKEERHEKGDHECAPVIDDVAYSASQVKRKKRLGGDGGGGGICGGKEAGGEGEPSLGGFLGALRGPTRRFKGVLDVNVAEARKARQLGSAAGCQNFCPLPPPHPNRITTYTQTSFFSSTTSTSCASSTSSSSPLR
ncbi:hypothetical protein ALC57_06883 [Trachymyrmex cornetzi]|uniref:Uncharacterized protein n=1 Tax=Trachymyrmex cornetzi TaxID=471704 RepID=A0A195E702_9HYME|nr:hypothetical protein ALC57_06883 [Trachymyrmex cornetzi]